jgi:hypothetical protein
MDSLPIDVISIIASFLDPISFIRFYETGWKKARSYYKFKQIYEENLLEYQDQKRKKKVEEQLEMMEMMANCLSNIRTSSVNLNGYNEVFARDRDIYADLLEQILKNK